MKLLADLTIQDLETNPVWRYEGGSGPEAAVSPVKRQSLSQADDEIFLAATEFELFDSSNYRGFCFPADDSGIDYLQPVILSPAGHVNFWFESAPAPEALSRQWKALGKEPREIFPVSFRCLVAVDGRTVTGRIEEVVTSENLASGPPAPTILPAGPFDEGSGFGRACGVPTARPVQARRDTGPVEKRTARRRNAEMTVEFAQGAFRGSGITRDLSPRGIFVSSAQIPGTGPMVRLTVNLSGGRTLVLKGRVVRGVIDTSCSAGPPGFGLRLAEESPEYQALLSLLRSKLK